MENEQEHYYSDENSDDYSDENEQYYNYLKEQEYIQADQYEEDFRNYLYHEYYHHLIQKIQLPAYLFGDVYQAIIQKQMMLIKDAIFCFEEGDYQEKQNFIYKNLVENFQVGVDYKQLSFDEYEHILGKISLDCLKQLLVLRNTEQCTLFRDQIILMEQQLTEIIQNGNLYRVIPLFEFEFE
ncbi:hypothetical protein ABPG72_010351 [Tetrahymena utriculariae]